MKKPRKFYAVSPQKWFLGSKVSKAQYEESQAAFLLISEAGEDEGKIDECLDKGRVYLQILFRMEDPSSHVVKLKEFWKMPRGLKLLNNYFEWLVDGSGDGSLAISIEDHISSILNLTAKILGDKRDKEWQSKLEETENNSQAKYGNDIMFKIHIIRELAKNWKNLAEKIIFIQGEDDMQNSSDQPYVHIVKVNRYGEGDFEEAIVISVKVGAITIFEDVTLSEGLAAVIQLCFVFHLCYPVDCDETFNFVQRLIAKFGPSEGAKNLRGQLRKKFVDFQCALADVVLMEKNGTVRKMFVC